MFCYANFRNFRNYRINQNQKQATKMPPGRRRYLQQDKSQRCGVGHPSGVRHLGIDSLRQPGPAPVTAVSDSRRVSDTFASTARSNAAGAARHRLQARPQVICQALTATLPDTRLALARAAWASVSVARATPMRRLANDSGLP